MSDSFHNKAGSLIFFLLIRAKRSEAKLLTDDDRATLRATEFESRESIDRSISQ